ncbi:MAG: ABC transporter permease [Nanoarchaeota archaeon]|nr:ABC transporter permease [Nanoarchaeota archaeon]
MKEYLNFAVQSIRHRKLRSLLTILGIVIGIAAIVSLISVSQGLGNAITQQFENLGSNRIYIFPAGGIVQLRVTDALGVDDADALRPIVGVEEVNEYLYDKFDVTYAKEDKYTSITGFEFERDPKEVFPEFGMELEDGRWLNDGEKYAVVIGPSLAHEGYDREIAVNSKVEINGEKYEVVGIFQSLGNEEDDNNVWMSMDNAREILNNEKGLSFIEVITQEDLNVADIPDKVEKTLKRKRDVDDFDVMIPEQLLAQLGNILNVLQVVLGGIAAISLFVGGVGIMNSMYTNVLERKKEIGIMKSIGATPKDIQRIFMVESGLMGLIGGVIGAAIGVILSFIVGELAAQAGFTLLKIEVEYFVIIFAISFAFIVGMVSGYLPAKEASKLLPVEALRE